MICCFDNEVDSASRKHVFYFYFQTDGVSASCRMVNAGSTHSYSACLTSSFNVDFKSDLVCSTVTYWFSGQASEQASEQVSEQVQILVNAIRENVYSMFDIQRRLNISSRRYVLVEMLTPAIEQGYVLRAYPDKPRHPKQRYYLSEKGLKLVK